MMNHCTYTQQREADLAVKRFPLRVELDGLSAPLLDVVEIIRQPGDAFHQATLQYIYGIAAENENAAACPRVGQTIHIRQADWSTAAGAHRRTMPLFVGEIISIESQWGHKLHRNIIQAQSRPGHNRWEIIQGVRIVDAAGEYAMLTSVPAVFNLNGRPNAGAALHEQHGSSYRFFDLNADNSIFWKIGDAIRYIAGEYLTATGIILPHHNAQLEALTADHSLGEFSVMGHTPLAALEMLCEQAKIRFTLKEYCRCDGGVGTCLHFYRIGHGRRVTISRQQRGEKLDLNKTTIIEHHETQAARRTNQLIGIGGYKQYEGTFELGPGWNQDLEIDNYDLYSPATNVDFAKVQDVFRKWVLNESGKYTGSPYGWEQAYDLADIFGHHQYGVHSRRFWPCLSQGANGESMGYYLEVSYEGGEFWRPYEGAFDVLLNECGIYLNVNKFPTELWIAIRKGALRFRITATILDDERLQLKLSDGPANQMVPIHHQILDWGNEYGFAKVSSQSIFYQDETMTAAQRDDSAQLRTRLRDTLSRLPRGQRSGHVTIPWIRPDIYPGDIIQHFSPDNWQTRTIPPHQPRQVNHVRLTFGNNWQTIVSYE